MKKLLTAAVLSALMLVGCATVQPSAPVAKTEPMMLLKSPNGQGYVALTLRDDPRCLNGSKLAFIRFNDGELQDGCYLNDGETVQLDWARGRVQLPYDQFRYIEVPLK